MISRYESLALWTSSLPHVEELAGEIQSEGLKMPRPIAYSSGPSSQPDQAIALLV
jgi:hypothetical protein